jgi:O-antigen/teichoic acid export membrane protein
MLGRITKNTTYLTLAFIGQKILALFYFIIIARVIGAEDLGKYAFALSIASLFGVFADLGLSQTLIREMAKNKDASQKYFSAAFAAKLILSIVAYAAIALAINLLGYPALVCKMVYLSGVVMVLDSFTLANWGVFRSRQILKYESWNLIINQVILLFAGFAALFFKLGLLYLVAALICASLWSVIFSSVLVVKKAGLKFSPKFNRPVLKTLFGISVAFALISIFSRIYGYLDSILLSYLAGDKALGYYSAAYKLPAALVFIPSALSAAIFPAFSETFAVNNPRHGVASERLGQLFQRAMAALMLIAVPIGIGIAGVSREIVLKFYGAQYLPGVEALKILAMATIFVFLNYPIGALFNACDRQKLNAALYGMTMCVNAILNFILIPRYEYLGAAIAFLASHSALFIVSLIFARRIVTYSARQFAAQTLKVVLSCFVMLFAIWVLTPMMNIFVVIGCAVIIYFVALFLLRGFQDDQIEFLRKIFKRQTAVVETQNGK